jgi:hypothetical protein
MATPPIWGMISIAALVIARPLSVVGALGVLGAEDTPVPRVLSIYPSLIQLS